MNSCNTMQLWIFAILLFLGQVLAVTTPHNCPGCVKVRVGAPQLMYGPIATSLDNPFFALKNSSKLLGYSANGNTYVIVDGNLNVTIPPATAKVALAMGDTGKFDECGAWLNNAVVDGNKVRGWYHAEKSCDYDNNGQTLKSIAYAESTDGGRTFTKPSYPNNQIISGVSQVVVGQPSGNGDQSVIVGTDGYYYCYFVDLDQYKIGVARSAISSGGGPGTWFKYYNGSFSQPGIGGKTSAVQALNSYTVMKHNSGTLMAINMYTSITINFGTGPTSWDYTEIPVLYSESSQWQSRTSSSSELIGYPSFVPLDGTDTLGNQFWLYYTYLYPGQGFDQRYQVRRLVTLTVTDSVVTPQSATAIVRYVNGTDYWTTTAIVTAGYTVDKLMGYIFPYNYPNTIAVYDCYNAANKDHFFTINKEECTVSGVKLLRNMGYVYTITPTGTNTTFTQIFRCYNDATYQHYVSTNQNCDSKGTYEYTIGFIAAS